MYKNELTLSIFGEEDRHLFGLYRLCSEIAAGQCLATFFITCGRKSLCLLNRFELCIKARNVVGYSRFCVRTV